MSNFEQVHEFHKAFQCNIGNVPSLPNETERHIRKWLLKEEYEEYLEGEANNDIVEIADGLVDMLYIIYGTGVSYGLPMDTLFDEVHLSNMSKLDNDGNPIFRADGKVLKGPNFFKPNIKNILESCT